LQLQERESRLQQRIGYHFMDRSHLRQALTHKSFSNEQPSGHAAAHNERLEFLGDAVLDLVISHILFYSFPLLPEGEMTRLRAEVVSERSLADIGREIALGDCLQLGRGEELTGGREKDSLIADALEALLGAVYCDGGWAGVHQVAEALFARAIEDSVRRKNGLDYKTRLQEVLQARYGKPPEYVLMGMAGPDHRRVYTMEVRFDDETIGGGSGRTKKAAEQEAARQALERLGQ
jgi:ribonuclease III